MQDVKLIVVSISEQTRASLANKYQISPQSVHQRLQSFFRHHLHVNYVFDIAFARDLSLMACAEEFLQRYREGNPNPLLASSCPGKDSVFLQFTFCRTMYSTARNNTKKDGFVMRKRRTDSCYHWYLVSNHRNKLWEVW